MMVGRRRASMVLPDPGGPIMSMLCAPAAATSRARLAALAPPCRRGRPRRPPSPAEGARPPGRSAAGPAPPASMTATAARSVSAGYTLSSGTSAASAALARGSTSPRRPRRLTLSATASPPTTARTLPSRPSSPTAAMPSAPPRAWRVARRKCESDGQVERRPLLAHIGRRQVDGDASRRELVVRVDDGRAHALAALLHGRIGQTHDGERGRRPRRRRPRPRPHNPGDRQGLAGDTSKLGSPLVGFQGAHGASCGLSRHRTQACADPSWW